MSAPARPGNGVAGLVAIMPPFLLFHLILSQSDGVFGAAFAPLTELVAALVAGVLAIGVTSSRRSQILLACLFVGGCVPALATFLPDSDPSQGSIVHWLKSLMTIRTIHLVGTLAYVLTLVTAFEAFTDRDRAKGFAIFPVAKWLAWAVLSGLTLYIGMVNQNYHGQVVVFRATAAIAALSCVVAFIVVRADAPRSPKSAGRIFAWNGAKVCADAGALLGDGAFVRLTVAAILVTALSNITARFLLPYDFSSVTSVGGVVGRTILQCLYPAAILAGAFAADALRRRTETAGVKVAMWAVLLSLPFFLIGIYSSSESSSRLGFLLALAACGAIFAPVFAAATNRASGDAAPLAIAVMSAVFLLVPTLGLGEIVAAVLFKMLGAQSVGLDLGFPGWLQVAGRIGSIIFPLKLTAQFSDAAALANATKTVSLLTTLALLAPAWLLYRLSVAPAAIVASSEAERACPVCGASNTALAKFCKACGTALTAEVSPPATAASDKRAGPFIPVAATAGLVLVATTLALGLYCGGAFEKGWSDGIVWNASDDVYPTMQACTEESCIIAVMTKNRASPDALAFANAWDDYIKGTDQLAGYADKFMKGSGRVDLVEVNTPGDEREDYNTIYFLDRKKIFRPDVDVDSLLRNNAKTASLFRNYYGQPFLTILDEYIREDKLPDGGQRFVFSAGTAMCMACELLARPTYGLDFDRYGRYQGPTVLDAGYGLTDEQVRRSTAAVSGAVPPVPD